MNPAIKGAISFGSVVGAGGLSYGVYNAMQPTPTVRPQKQKTTTYADVFQGTLLSTTDNNDQAKWTARLASLKSIDSAEKLVQNLRELKTKTEDDQWKKLRTWCKDTISEINKGKDNQEFQNIQNYCTYSIKEKITGTILENEDDGDAKWLAGHQELSKIEIENLDNALKLAKEKNQDQEKKTAIKTWCTAAYKKPYKGPEDKDFKNASRICKKS